MSDTAVLVIDMMNTYRHPDAEKLVPNIARIIDHLAKLMSTARYRDDVDLIYVNDNYGDFAADNSDIIRCALEGERPDLIKPIVPELAGLLGVAPTSLLAGNYPRRVDAPELIALLAGLRISVLTGAGISTDSGIPDYRGPDSPPSNPMTIRQFTSDPVFRQRYWARNHVGWLHMHHRQPNAGHRALAALEYAGVVSGVITQNVDLLHTKAGSRRVVDLHGSYAEVTCLDCEHTMTRDHLRHLLDALNPGFAERVQSSGGPAVAPDADAIVADTSSFRIADCPACGGMLKPNIVYFGENVPKDRVDAAYALVDDAEALLVAGSSLTVYSGYRFVRHAAANRVPIAIVNRGPTRGDALANVTVDGGCSPVLAMLANELSVPAVPLTG